MIRFNLKVFTVFVLLAGFLHSVGAQGRPDWVDNPPEPDTYIYAVGFAGGDTEDLAREASLQNARAELTKQVSKKVSALCRDYMKHSKASGNLDAQSAALAKAVSQDAVVGAQLRDAFTEKTGKSYNYYALLAVRAKSVLAAVEDYLVLARAKAAYKAAENDLEDMVSSIRKRYGSEIAQKSTAPTKTQTLSVQQGKEPAWVKRMPNDKAYYIGIGTDKNLEAAKMAAVNTVVSQIKVKIKSETNSYMREINGVSDEDVSVNIKMSVKDNIEDVEYFDAWQSPGGDYWVYARLNIELYQRKMAEKMENARITALDYLIKSDEEDNPTLAFKYAFLGYYYLSPYVTKALRADYKGRDVILINELTARMNKILSSTTVSVYQTSDELKMAKVDTKPLRVDLTFESKGEPMGGLPVKFAVSDNAASITTDGVTDADGEVTCIISSLHRSASTFHLYAESEPVRLIADLIDDPELQAFFERKISLMQAPKKQIMIEVERPTLGFAVFVTDDFKNPKFNSAAINFGNTFKNRFAEQMKTNFVDRGAQYDLQMTVSGTVAPSDGPSGFIFARMRVAFRIKDNKTGKEIYNLVCDEVKQGANTDIKAVQNAINKFDMNKAVKEILDNGIN